MLGNVKIEKLCRSINLIEPYMPENQQPCSYDLTLGDGFLEPADQLIDMVYRPEDSFWGQRWKKLIFHFGCKLRLMAVRAWDGAG
jgi:deoxycytidine triphosphate deaminase